MFPLAAASSARIDGPCDGTATIGEETYTQSNDTPANPIVIPKETGLVAEWEGTTGVVITDYVGRLGIAVGPATITIAEWAGSNDNHETQESGRYELDELRTQLPIDIVGIYEVTGFHHGDGGQCDGFVMVKIEGNPLTTPIGAGAAAGAAVAGAGLVLAGLGRTR